MSRYHHGSKFITGMHPQSKLRVL